jgi:hypothetical protein
MIPPKLKTGDTLNLGWLNGVRSESAGGRLKVDPRTGLKLVVTSFGAFLTSLAPPDGWYLVRGTATGVGNYSLTEQVDEAAGAWMTGPRLITAYEANLNASVPSASTVRVWASYRRGQWRFRYGACS